MVKALGTSTRGMSERRMANGIMPITGPKINGGRIYYFKKADLEAVDLTIIMPNAKNSTLQKMNEQGLVTKRQLADITGYTMDQIDGIVMNGRGS